MKKGGKSMKLRKIGVVLLALLLAGMAMVPMVNAGTPVTDSLQSTSENNQQLLTADAHGISITEAETIALANVKLVAGIGNELKIWKDASVRYSTTYYDLNDQKSAYSFDVLVNGNYAGYILISATPDNYPVLALSKGKIPNADQKYTSSTKQSADKFAREKGLQTTNVEQIYLGGLNFYHKYQLTDAKGTKMGVTFVDLHSNQVVDLMNTSHEVSIPVDSAKIAAVSQEKRDTIENAWINQRKLVSGDTSVLAQANTYQTSSLYTNTVSGVPLYFWRDGCSPTAAGMVLGYWQSHGYPNLPTGNTLIDNLATAMGTGSTWPLNGMTFPTAIDSGISTVTAQHGYSNLHGVSSYAPSFTDDMNEIDAQRPFVLSMLYGGTGAGRSTPYGQHSVAAIGYINSVPQLVKIYDTWYVSGDPTNYNYHWLQYGNWGWGMNTYVRP
jgi:hypothetical protein